MLVVEVLSPDDTTIEKLDFCTEHGVRELLVVDGQDRSVGCFALQKGQAEGDRCDVLGLATEDIATALDRPPLDDAGSRAPAEPAAPAPSATARPTEAGADSTATSVVR